jgi:hypothetical protein
MSKLVSKKVISESRAKKINLLKNELIIRSTLPVGANG